MFDINLDYNIYASRELAEKYLPQDEDSYYETRKYYIVEYNLIEK